MGPCKNCGKIWPLQILENGNGLCPMCQKVQERQKDVAQIIRTDDTVTVITEQGNSVTREQHDYWSDSSNNEELDKAIEEALDKDEKNARTYSHEYRNNHKINPMDKSTDNVTSDIRLVKNTVLWSLNSGEVARRINVNEFANITNAKGVYVQEGVVAVLMIDGRIVAQLSSGVYYFPTGIERFGGALRNIWRFFAGKKGEGDFNQDEIRRGRIGSVLQNLGKQALIDVVLMTEGVIPVVLGVKVSNGTMEFVPYVIQSSLADINVGVSMNLGISDFYKFRINYLTKSSSCRIHDLQMVLNDPIRNTIQEVLAYETIESSVFPPEVKERLKRDIVKKANAVLLGVEVSQLVDITLKSEDFDRFREIEHRLYCSKKELDYLIRTNDFKNRLQDEENAQIIREAKSEEELRYALNKLNKDKLLHDDEMEAFCQLLASQKAIRTAQTDADIEKALLDIKKNSLIAQDDFEAIESELRINKGKRVEVEEIFRWQSIRRVESERIAVQKDIEQVSFELDKQKQTHAHDLEKDNVLHTVGINDIMRGEIRKDDEYSDERRIKIHDIDIQEIKDAIDIVDDDKRREIERARIAQENALKSFAVIEEIKRTNKAQDYEHEIKLNQIGAETQISLAKIKADMSADQIAASQLDRLSESGQVALAAAISSQKELDWLKAATEEKTKFILDFVEKNTANERELRQQQERTMDKVMDFASNAMATNASVVTGAVQGQREAVSQILSTVKEVSTHRLNEVERDKQEYKSEAHHAQSRLDHTQDTALHYTTSKAKSEVTADAIKNSDSPIADIIKYNIVAYGAGFFTGLADVLAMINAGDITPDTELNINGKSCMAYERPELRSMLEKKYGSTCESCGTEGLKGRICPECGNII